MFFDPGAPSIPSHIDLDGIAFWNADTIGLSLYAVFRGSITRLSPYGLQSPCLRLTQLVMISLSPRLSTGWVGLLFPGCSFRS